MAGPLLIVGNFRDSTNAVCWFLWCAVETMADGAIFQAFCESRGDPYLPTHPKTIRVHRGSSEGGQEASHDQGTKTPALFFELAAVWGQNGPRHQLIGNDYGISPCPILRELKHR